MFANINLAKSAVLGAIAATMIVGALYLILPIPGNSAAGTAFAQDGIASRNADQAGQTERQALQSPTNHVFSVPPAAWVPMGDGQDWTIVLGDLRVSSGTGWFAAPVYLPSGAVVTKLTVYGYDPGIANSYTVYLYRRPVATTATVPMAMVTSQDNPAMYNPVFTTSISKPTINNGAYTYYLVAYLTGPTDLRINAVKINYLY